MWWSAALRRRPQRRPPTGWVSANWHDKHARRATCAAAISLHLFIVLYSADALEYLHISHFRWTRLVICIVLVCFAYFGISDLSFLGQCYLVTFSPETILPFVKLTEDGTSGQSIFFKYSLRLWIIKLVYIEEPKSHFMNLMSVNEVEMYP